MSCLLYRSTSWRLRTVSDYHLGAPKVMRSVQFSSVRLVLSGPIRFGLVWFGSVRFGRMEMKTRNERAAISSADVTICAFERLRLSYKHSLASNLLSSSSTSLTYKLKLSPKVFGRQTLLLWFTALCSYVCICIGRLHRSRARAYAKQKSAIGRITTELQPHDKNISPTSRRKPNRLAPGKSMRVIWFSGRLRWFALCVHVCLCDSSRTEPKVSDPRS